MENPCKIVTFGDSITKGYTNFFKKQITKEYSKIKIKIINAGKVGETSTDGLKRLPQVIKEKPNVVIVGFGMNDWRKGISQTKFKKNLEIIIDRLEKHKIRVLLMTIILDYQGFFRGTSKVIEEYNQIIKKTAYKKRIRIVDIYSLWKKEIRPVKKGLSDNIHPNKLGYETICKALMRVVPRRNTTIVWQYAGIHCNCNYSCPYCYVPNDVNVGEYFIGTIEKWHRAFKKAFGNQNLTFYLSFGEPMIHKHFWEVIKMVGAEPNWEIMMTSNLSQPINRLVKTKLAKEGRLNINASFHPTQTTIEKFLAQLLNLRKNGIESPVVYVMYPPQMKKFEEYFKVFDKNNFLVHVRRFRGNYQGKYYPKSYTEEERQLVAKYMDDASIKYMLSDQNMKGKLSYAGMFYLVVTNKGDIGLCPDYMKDFKRGNILKGNVNLDIEPQPLPDIKDGTVDGVACLLETGYHELEGNHVTSFAKQGGVYHTKKGVHYPRLKTNFLKNES